MAELVKQLKIKTSILKRLRKEYESYEMETKAISGKLTVAEGQQKVAPSEDIETVIRKNKQFLGQSESVLSNVKQKLIEAFEGLATFLNEKGAAEGVNGSQEKNLAENLVLDVETFLEGLA